MNISEYRLQSCALDPYCGDLCCSDFRRHIRVNDKTRRTQFFLRTRMRSTSGVAHDLREPTDKQTEMDQARTAI
jgi:hypothetical protein